MINIPPLDLTEQYTLIGDEVNAVVLELLASGRYIGGPPVKDFEEQFAHYIGADYCVACNSGTDALYLALRALDIGAGDEVITTPFTFFATAEVISAVGATPVFVDIDPDTFNLDTTQLAAVITDRTRAIIPVHLFGQPADMTRVMAIADANNLFVVEDCAQATGAEWQGQRVGSIGHIGCFSFFPTKNLGACGDGGAITTDDPAVADRIRALREHGMRVRYYHDEIGVTSRLDAIQAVILQVKLRYLDRWNQQRRDIADRYTQSLSLLPGITTPRTLEGAVHVWHQYTIRLALCGEHRRCGAQPCSLDGSKQCRNWLREQLQTLGVSSMIYYPVPVHLQAAYSRLGFRPGQFPVTEQVAQEVLSLPMFPELTIEQQQRVIDAIKECLATLKS
ncbi:MAG: DegT/DnrJ/EryC1/StrS family aminotransferase [Cyanobacteria bacterium]|nr:DegT/DnrJ/EryC1/StrS family aminotransferase [Cyanobacteriota bacterium]MDW8201717.1 DegT/DnrJ/EryC1/StrS family aminotransferase [Cyanobacteriota bacterium SKYGB_h_bin112]